MCFSHPQSHRWAVGGPGPHGLGSRLEAGFRWAPCYIPELRLEDQQPLECALLMQDGRGTRAGQKLCSERAHGHCRSVQVTWQSRKVRGVGKGSSPSWKITKSVTPWQQQQMLDGSRVLSGLVPGCDSASGSGSVSSIGSQASSVRGSVAFGKLSSSFNGPNLASEAFRESLE